MELSNLGLAAVSSITVLCYLVGLIMKATPWDNDKFIPIACGVAGGILGVTSGVQIPIDDIYEIERELPLKHQKQQKQAAETK